MDPTQKTFSFSYNAETMVMEHTHLRHNISFHGTPLPGDTWDWGMRHMYIIHYITNGKGTLETEGQVFHLTAGQAFLIVPFQIVRYTSDPKNPWTYWWVEWSGEGSDTLMKAMGFTREHPVMAFHNPAEVLAAMERLERTQDNHSLLDCLERKGELYRLMACFLRNSPRAQGPKVPESRVYYDTAERYIQQHLDDPELSVNGIADLVGISRKYLHAIFIQYSGKSVSDYIIHYRILTAEELLKSKHHSITTVANAVGYNDPFSFSRIFKKRTGLSPTQFANEMQKKKK